MNTDFAECVATQAARITELEAQVKVLREALCNAMVWVNFFYDDPAKAMRKQASELMRDTAPKEKQ